jgi:hypothetical protein
MALSTIVVSIALACTAATGGGKVRVYVLAGQSNMEGYGHVRTLARLGEEPAHAKLLAHLRAKDGSWAVRDDVFVHFRSGAKVGPLSVGFGADAERIGPELGFGTVEGDARDEPVLLIKTAWGGKDLHFDFRPPSAGPLPYPIDPEALEKRGGAAAVGACYRKMVADVHDCIDHLGRYFPPLAGKECEIAGLVWVQGWNEMFPSRGCEYERVLADYPGLYATMIADLERDLGVKRLPSVVGEMGVDGDHAGARLLALRKAQAAIAALPQLAGKVRFVETASLWDGRLDQLQAREREILASQKKRLRPGIEERLSSALADATEGERRKAIDKAVDEAARGTDEYRAWQVDWDQVASHWECHYFGSARTYCLIGTSLAQAMEELLSRR